MRLIDVRTGLDVLNRDACQELLLAASGGVGRVAVADGSHPVILPVNFAMDEDRVVFRTAAGTKLDAVLHGAHAAFEIDDIDPATESGWSVVVRGRSELVTNDVERQRLATELPLRPWAGEEGKTNWIVIVPEIVTGRQLRPDVER